MTPHKKRFAIGFAVLALALILGFAGRWAEKQVETAPDPTVALRAEAMASRFFTLAIVFVVIAGLEFQSARTARRLSLLEQEIETLRNRPGATA